MFNLENFINTCVTKRNTSMFGKDIETNKKSLFTAIEGNSVLVIGGAGCIGSNFIKAILPFRPSELYIVDTNENALTELTRDLRSSGVAVPDSYVPLPIDYSSKAFVRMFKKHRCRNGESGFDIIANFSAHKHVRSEKDVYSLEALLRNNVINAKRLLDLLSSYPPQIYFCVSTDKAANPVNVMGASKRIMEDLVFSYSMDFPVKTARFANVAFSNGSLPDGMLHRLALYQPISAPSDVKRYFVSPKESGQICMMASVLGRNRDIFFPKLSKESMITFEQIARELIAAYGYQVQVCNSDKEAVEVAKKLKMQSGEIKIYPACFSISDTNGEKAVEEFYTKNEAVDLQRFSSLGVITDKGVPDRDALEYLISALDEAFERPDCNKADIIGIISAYLPDFHHIETGKSLDEKM